MAIDNSQNIQASPAEKRLITAETLGSQEFKRDYGLRYAYVAGSMFKGIGSKEIVVAMGTAGMIGFLGAGGMKFSDVEASIQFIQAQLSKGQSYGANLLSNLDQPEYEANMVDLYLRYGIRYVEAAGYTQMTPGLVRFRLLGLERQTDGKIATHHHILAKVSRPEVAEMFLRPAPESIVSSLLEQGAITPEQAELGRQVPVSHDICVEADSGGQTDQGVAYAIVPAIQQIRDRLMKDFGFSKYIRVGTAGGIGTPQAAAAAFIMGSDFILTGSINQCTTEAGTSDAVKDMLQGMNVQDTEYAPTGGMFELGAKVQVLKKGLFFPARANKLYALYQQYDAIEDIDEKTKSQLEQKYFKRSIADVWQETEAYYKKTSPGTLEKAAQHPKLKMALIFKWYFVHTTRLALKGSSEQKVDYQIHCGPALGSFNQWVKGTEMESWRKRNVAEIAAKIMQATADVLCERFSLLTNNSQYQDDGLYVSNEIANKPNPNNLHRLHPLLHSGGSDSTGHRYQSLFTGQEEVLVDHKVQGEKILPGVAYLELARVAGEFSLHRKITGIKNIRWLQPVRVANQPVRIHTDIFETDKGVTYKIYSELGNEKVIHSQGVLETEPLISPQPVDLKKLQESLPDKKMEDECYAMMEGKGINYGPSFRCSEVPLFRES